MVGYGAVRGSSVAPWPHGPILCGSEASAALVLRDGEDARTRTHRIGGVAMMIGRVWTETQPPPTEDQCDARKAQLLLVLSVVLP